ncbi:peptidase inhibitor family I36 protein [Glycomyces sp. NPDC047010]|uniref:peptidase inhibitor family I36 protein n=1 Tax=Glycomyces sp. NPDC047010 TaxID=3155023 RepID=UPI0033F08630
MHTNPLFRSRRTPALAAAFAAMLIALVTVLGDPSAASSPRIDSVQAKIDAVLANSTDGVQINENEIAWDGGTMVLTIPEEGEDTAIGPNEIEYGNGYRNCPRGWTCLYEDRNFEGVRVRFTECGFIHQLSKTEPYFRDMASSYHDNQTGGVQTTVYNWHDWTGWIPMWTSAPAPTSSTYVGDDKNDRADGVKAC